MENEPREEPPKLGPVLLELLGGGVIIVLFTLMIGVLNGDFLIPPNLACVLMIGLVVLMGVVQVVKRQSKKTK